ncbi:MAG: hemerythrin domain-containing protein [Nitrososphaerota archaeon]|nr:hemerythrin domain-containing protein [Nitrososphaerota archaeon]MDG7023930.1 hemerythrin domain-containing protein [Nitrososphaerota archaeon]
MQSLERLTMEHALVGRGLGALEVIVRKIGAGEAVPDGAVQRLLDFFQVFGDRYHHVKEEHVLIPELEDGCESRSRCHLGPAIGAVYYDHEVARRVLRDIRQASEDLTDREARDAFVEEAEEYIAFMRQHIAGEKESLIRAASWKLAGEDSRLVHSFNRYEQRETITETARQFASEIDDILAELSIEVPPARVRAYSRGTIPYHRSTDAPIQF